METTTASASRPGTAIGRKLALRRWRYPAAFAAYAGITVAWLSPMALHLTSRVLQGPSDMTLSAWQYWANGIEGKTPWTATHTALIGAPEGLPLPTAVNWAAPVQPAFVWLFKGQLGYLGSLNLFIIIGFVLTSFLMFVLLDRLDFHPVASFFGGYVVAFNPWAFERAFSGHAAFLHGWVFIVLILALLAVHTRRTVGSAVIAGLAFGGAFLMASYFGLLASLVVVVFFLIELAWLKRAHDLLQTVVLGLLTGATAGAMLVPAVFKYQSERTSVNRTLGNALTQVSELSAAPSAYVLPSHRNPFLGFITRSFAYENFSEQTLFFGYTTIGLAIVGVVLLLRRHPDAVRPPLRHFTLVFAAILAPAAFVASLPRIVHVFGLPLPTISWFVTHVTTFFRAYARFGLIVAIGLAILAAVSLDVLTRRRRHGMSIGVGLTVLVALELLVWPIKGWDAKLAPAWVKVLASQPRGIVANYPMLTDKSPAIRLAERAQYYQMLDGQPLFTLFGSGILNSRESSIRVLSRYVTDPGTPGILAAEGVRYVVVHDDVYRAQGETPPDLPEGTFRLLERVGPVRIYTLHAAPVDLDGTLVERSDEVATAGGWKQPSAQPGSGFYDEEPNGRWMMREGVLRIDNRATETSLFDLELPAFSNQQPRRLFVLDAQGRELGSAMVETQGGTFRVGPFRLPSGVSTLRLRTEPGPTLLGANDPRVASVFLGPATLRPIVDVENSIRAG